MTLKFPKAGEFQAELKLRVEQYFQDRKISKRDRPSMYTKAAIIVSWAVVSYAFLVFGNLNPGPAIAWGLSLAFALVGVGFNIQHDGNHQGFSRFHKVNRATGFTLDLIGASSYFWCDKHNNRHHTYTNIVGEDDDISLWPFGRTDPAYPRLWFHRYQHFYVWALYTVIHIRYVLMDLHRLLWRKASTDRKPFDIPKKWKLVEFIAGKAIFATLAFVIPSFFHPWTVVLGFFVGISLVIGLTFGIVFQMAHLVDIVEHPGRVDGVTKHEFFVHQIETTANFATTNRFWTVCLGGLNFQREHHLFPRVSHVHYPQIAKIVREVCDKYGIRYREHASFISGIKSHYRFLRQMGRRDAAA
jgi:linoleoyl-CoA desaturase